MPTSFFAHTGVICAKSMRCYGCRNAVAHSHHVWVALQVGCSQAVEANEHSSQTPLQLQPSLAQPAGVTLPSSTTVAMTGSAQTLSELDEAMGLPGLQDQAQAVARAELLPGFIHHSLLELAFGNKLPAKKPLYGLYRALQEGQMLMVYGTNLCNVELVTGFHRVIWRPVCLDIAVLLLTFIKHRDRSNMQVLMHADRLTACCVVGFNSDHMFVSLIGNCQYPESLIEIKLGYCCLE